MARDDQIDDFGPLTVFIATFTPVALKVLRCPDDVKPSRRTLQRVEQVSATNIHSQIVATVMVSPRFEGLSDREHLANQKNEYLAKTAPR